MTDPPERPASRRPVLRPVEALRPQAAFAIDLLRWVALGLLVGVLAGGAAAVFLASLRWATETFDEHGGLLWFLPLAGLAIGLAYHYGGGRSVEGGNLILDEIHDPTDWVPRRMAPMILIGTITTHLFGGSAGREGTAIQMSGSLTDAASRLLRLGRDDRRIMLVTAIAGGFGAVFGVPLAGAVFALEVQSVGRLRYEALVPCLTASVTGDLVVEGLGIGHTLTPHLGQVDLSVGLLLKVALAGALFGLASVAFSIGDHWVKRAFGRWVAWPPARPLLGGAMVVALTLAVGNRLYNGLSEGLAEASLLGAHVPTWAFALKLLFTIVTLGSGFVGGEVTPLFVIGATLGATLAAPLGVPPELLAALGFVAVFAGASNTPLACTIMGVELFGAGAVPYFAVACVMSYVFSAHQGIYRTQRSSGPKVPGWQWARWSGGGTEGSAP
ncbi:voltage-gated chloride channel family protein [Dermatobacter hominis]|uniref:voltage-gated chloride channel family protein n=1 Tax=Dermatobacter hominis TaxID=2884263 RepID=UPI001D0FDE2E|nr:voltage-gated chloride channel family protein [Dermatobacter hominis]UDY34062.1 voltage-gated chloride channel family protein [Dermatobacter hominis]